MNRKEFDTIKNLFVILDEDLKLIYYNKFNKSMVYRIIKVLEIRKCIKKNNSNYKELENYNYKIKRYKANNSNIFVVEIEYDFLWNLRNNIHIDNLTGLYNRDFWLDIVNDKVPYFDLNYYSIIQVIHIDNYKQIEYSNDNLSSENCIKEISHIIRNNIDKKALAFRYKQNEIIIISNINYENKIKEYISEIEVSCDISIGSCELNNRSILGQALTTATVNKKMYIQKSRSNKIKYTNIENEMDKLKEKLNLLMQNNYKNNYNEVLEVSIELDNVITEYCMLEKKK